MRNFGAGAARLLPSSCEDGTPRAGSKRSRAAAGSAMAQQPLHSGRERNRGAHVREDGSQGGVRITSLGMKFISQPDGAEFVYEPGL